MERTLVSGFLEAVRLYQVRGWAYDARCPEAHCIVELRRGSDTLGRATADQMRPDLLDAGVGDGSHGFIVNVDVKLPLLAPESLAVFVLAEEGKTIELPAAKPLYVEHLVVSIENKLEADSEVIGYYLVSEDDIAGWAYDPTSPTVPLNVEIRVGEHVAFKLVADGFLPDLVAACNGHAEHGFRIGPEAGLAQSIQKMSVYAADVKGRKRALTALPRHMPEVSHFPIAASESFRFTGSASDARMKPVFVLGAPRSGTSAMAQALTKTTRYKGPEEGHFLDLALSLVGSVDRHYAARAQEWSERASTLIAATPPDFVIDGVKHIFVEFARARFPENMWVDKTPRIEMIAAAKLMKDIWPNARFIFMKRRAIENVVSRIRKFPSATIDQHCRDWVAAMSTWASIRDSLGAAAIEVDQFDLAKDPLAVTDALSQIIDLTIGEKQELTKAFHNDKPERTSANLLTSQSLSSLDWTPEDIATIVSVCGPQMQSFGYTWDEQYKVEKTQWL